MHRRSPPKGDTALGRGYTELLLTAEMKRAAESPAVRGFHCTGRGRARHRIERPRERERK
jgi:hypothetical protein